MEIYEITIGQVLDRMDQIIGLYEGVEDLMPIQTADEYLMLAIINDWYNGRDSQ